MCNRVCNKKSLLIIAGEASADHYAAAVVRKLQEREDLELEVFGIGGPEMKKAGVSLMYEASDLAVVGALVELWEKLGVLRKALKDVKSKIFEKKLDLVLLLDFPDFNFRVAKWAHQKGIRVIYYISPQLWAWRPGRVKKLSKFVDRLLVILPFEKEWYHQTGYPLDVDYVGHPLLEKIEEDILETGTPQNDSPASYFSMALLPGSRGKEVKSLLPIMLEAAVIIHLEMKRKSKKIRFLVSVAPTISKDLIQEMINEAPLDLDLMMVEGPMSEVLSQVDFAITCSGTATLETGLWGVPMVIVYRLSKLSYYIGRLLVDTPYMGLVNIIAGQEVCPELLQQDVTSEGIADSVLSLLQDKDHLSWMKKRLGDLRSQLGQNEEGASQKVAEHILSFLRE